MKLQWLIVAGVLVGVVAADSAFARSRHYRIGSRCADRPYQFSIEGLLFNHPSPNGCAPPVYVGGEYVGQDPDANIRLQLKRDPSTGYAYDLAH